MLFLKVSLFSVLGPSGRLGFPLFCPSGSLAGTILFCLLSNVKSTQIKNVSIDCILSFGPSGRSLYFLFFPQFSSLPFGRCRLSDRPSGRRLRFGSPSSAFLAVLAGTIILCFFSSVESTQTKNVSGGCIFVFRLSGRFR